MAGGGPRKRYFTNFLQGLFILRSLVVNFLNVQSQHIHGFGTILFATILINFHQSLDRPIVILFIKFFLIKFWIHKLLSFIIIGVDDWELYEQAFGLNFPHTVIGDYSIAARQCQLPVPDLFQFAVLFGLSALLHNWD